MMKKPTPRNNATSNAWLTCLSSLQHELTMLFPHDWWTSWFCQDLGLAIPALSDSQRICACAKFILDPYGDHSDVLPTQRHHQRCTRAHSFCSRHHVQAQRLHHQPLERDLQPWLKKGVLEIRDINLAGQLDLMTDVPSFTNSQGTAYLMHDATGNCAKMILTCF